MELGGVIKSPGEVKVCLSCMGPDQVQVRDSPSGFGPFTEHWRGEEFGDYELGDQEVSWGDAC